MSDARGIGLGMSILATNLGFSAAITNPFTIGVAQELAGLPLFSGAGLRMLIFGAIYGILAVFLVRYARSVERSPESSPVFKEDLTERAKYEPLQLMTVSENPRLGKAIALAFAEAGADLVVTARSVDQVEETSGEIEKLGRK
ncbi:MAG: hypothetical protein P8Y83_08485, partial [Gammaproteobacteria bacterium]